MDAEKSSNSSFEDLSNVNEEDLKAALQEGEKGTKEPSEANLDAAEKKGADLKTSSASLLEEEKRVEKSAEHVKEAAQKAESATLLDEEKGTNSKVPSATLLDEEGVSEKSATGLKSASAALLTEEKGADRKTASATLLREEHAKHIKEPTPETDNAESKQEKGEQEHQTVSVGDDEPCDILGNGQLIKRVVQKAHQSQRPTRGDLVTISFTAGLEDGTVVEREENFQLHIGDFEVVQGLDMTIPLMNVGEVAEVLIDPRFAYGAIGLKNPLNPDASIPPNTKIAYKVHLVNMKHEDFSDLKSFELRRKYGTRKKERANFWYNRQEYNTAIQLYRRALEFLDDRDGDPDAPDMHEDIEMSNSDLQALLEDRLIVYNNLAMAQIKISAFDAALTSVEHVLRCQPSNSKALYRKGRILEGKGDTKGAISLLQKAATLEPESKAIQQDLSKLIIKSRREEHNEKEMYQKMLGQAKKLEQRNKQPQKQQTSENSKLKVLGYIMGSILVGVAGVAIYRYKY